MRLRMILAAPLVAYLLICSILLMRGRPGEWHGRCVQFWQQQNWGSLCSLAVNLDQLGTPDVETEYFAALAARQMNSTDAAIGFASRWLSRRALNWNWESDMSSIAPVRNLVDRARAYRTRLTIVLLALIIPLNVLSIRKLSWNAVGSALSVIGIALLFI